MINIFSYDPLSIPDVFRIPASVIMGCAIAVLPFLFISSILEQNVRILTGCDTSYNREIKMLILVFTGLTLYRHIFLKIVALCQILSMSVADNKQIYDAINFIASQSYSYVDAALGGGNAGHAIAALTTVVNLLSPKVLIMGFLTVLFQITEPVLLFLRYALLAFLYIFGPLAFVAALYKHTRDMIKGWFINLFQISFWIVTLRILELIIVQLQLQEYVKAGKIQDILPWMIINFIFVVFIVITPIVTAKILSNENLGAVASLIVGAVAVTFGHAGVVHSSLKNGVIGNAVKSGSSAVANSHTVRLLTNAVKGANEIARRSYTIIRRQPTDRQTSNEAPRR